jgi:GNAT superfamily N-acetyltransferase
MDDWRIERLGRSHARSGFDCGKGPLNDFLRSLVSQYEKRNLGRTYVALRPGEKRVLGYYTLASGAISFQNLPADAVRKLPRHPVPVILLARLAVDRSAQGSGLGRTLLVDALKRSLGLADRLGIHAVEVDAIDAAAKSFYEKFGFVPHLDNEFHLYLPMATIKIAFGAG